MIIITAKTTDVTSVQVAAAYVDDDWLKSATVDVSNYELQLICINDLSSLTVCLNLLICGLAFTYMVICQL